MTDDEAAGSIAGSAAEMPEEAEGTAALEASG